MCRKNQLWGLLLMAFGTGMLLACCFESGFFCGLLGLGLAIAGGVMACKKG